MPDLTIIAGCNGAGKSIFAPSFLPDGIASFDFDKLFLDHYNSLPDCELRELFARNSTAELFERSVRTAIQHQTDFCYETNFDAGPLYWPQLFREQGFILNLIFFCIDNQEIARHRIQVRTEFNGHFVDNKTIDIKWKAGYKNVNLHHAFFDNVLFVDNSNQNQGYTNILQIEKGQIVLMSDKLPDYFKHRLPEIYNLARNL